MHFTDGHIPEEYQRYLAAKKILLAGLLVLTGCALVLSISLGAARIAPGEALSCLLGLDCSSRNLNILINIRLPQALTAMVAGAGLAVSGTAMQAILRNPLGSPFTLGISHAAAFGAAVAVMFGGGGGMSNTAVAPVTISNPWLTSGSAFAGSLAASLVIIAISRLRGATPEIIVLTGVALGSLCTAGTMLLQFFADDVQLAAMVFWTFGDTGRASWRELGFMAAVTLPCCLFFLSKAWDFNGIDAGDETARGLGIRVGRVRLAGMLFASLLTAVITSFLGIIGFVGLVVPHMMRRLTGADHRYLLPASILTGALLLLLSDTAARLVLAPHLLPVSVLTAFLGAPVFLLLILRGGRR